MPKEGNSEHLRRGQRVLESGAVYDAGGTSTSSPHTSTMPAAVGVAKRGWPISLWETRCERSSRGITLHAAQLQPRNKGKGGLCFCHSKESLEQLENQRRRRPLEHLSERNFRQSHPDLADEYSGVIRGRFWGALVGHRSMAQITQTNQNLLATGAIGVESTRTFAVSGLARTRRTPGWLFRSSSRLFAVLDLPLSPVTRTRIRPGVV